MAEDINNGSINVIIETALNTTPLGSPVSNVGIRNRPLHHQHRCRLGRNTRIPDFPRSRKNPLTHRVPPVIFSRSNSVGSAVAIGLRGGPGSDRWIPSSQRGSARVNLVRAHAPSNRLHSFLRGEVAMLSKPLRFCLVALASAGVLSDSKGAASPAQTDDLARQYRPPPLWQLRAALPAPRAERGSEPPVISRENHDENPPGPGHGEPGIDVQINQEIIDKAAALGTPLAMYEFVRNECAFQAYYGSRKGSIETLRQRAGNDYDLASLLIALFRASAIPARFASGIVEMSAAQATGWLGVDSADVAASILFTNGLEGLAITNAGNVVAVRCRRVWVEAFLPRGRGSPAWVPLDPAFYATSIHAGLDIPEAMGLDAQSFVDEYYDPTDPSVTLPRPETVLELLKLDITAYLTVNLPGMTLTDVMRTGEIVPENLGGLPAALPGIVLSRDMEYSEVPADRRYQIRFHLHSGGTTLIDHTVNLPEIAGRRVSIDYVGATPADQTIIDSYGGIYGTPPYLVNLKPVLRVDGVDVAVGVAGVGMGRVHDSDIHFLAPVNSSGLPQNEVPAIYNTIVCGAAQVVGIAIEGISEGLLNPPPVDDTEGLASLRYDTAMDYLANCRNADLELGRLMHAYVTTNVADAIVENVVNVTYDAFGVPQTFEWVGLRVDADRSILGYWMVDRYDPADPESKDFIILAGAQGSLNESLIYEDSYGQDSVSTIKILELASDAGITIYKRWSSTTLPANTQPAQIRNAIQSAIAAGQVVTFPADPITAGDPASGEWTGTGWIAMNPSNGAAGYIISGNNNGGATVEIWPPEFIDLSKDDLTIEEVQIEITKPVADSPDPSAIFTRDQEEHLEFEYKVHVTYTNGTTRTLPAGGGTYKKRTRNTTKTLVPSNYTFTVWIARRFWWVFNTTIARADRKLSVVGVLIRQNDGTVAGKNPPKYIPVTPDPPATPSTEPLMALVIPEKASDGINNLGDCISMVRGCGAEPCFREPAHYGRGIE